MTARFCYVDVIVKMTSSHTVISWKKPTRKWHVCMWNSQACVTKFKNIFAKTRSIFQNTRPSVISTRTSVISARKVWISHAREWFPHAWAWFRRHFGGLNFLYRLGWVLESLILVPLDIYNPKDLKNWLSLDPFAGF
jgi:hypothetical protein